MKSKSSRWGAVEAAVVMVFAVVTLSGCGGDGSAGSGSSDPNISGGSGDWKAVALARRMD